MPGQPPPPVSLRIAPRHALHSYRPRDLPSVWSYAADDSDLASPQQKQRRRKAQERKKGIPWTEQQHRKFLDGLRQLGKGDWRGISKNFVTTRTATQVASHAQKYFLRQTNPGKKKRRASLFDVGIADYNNDQVLQAPGPPFRVELQAATPSKQQEAELGRATQEAPVRAWRRSPADCVGDPR